MAIILERSESILNYFITMFSIINKATSHKELNVIDGKWIIRNKEQDEIFDFIQEAKVKALKNKILEGFFKGASRQLLPLTEEESELLRSCSYAAYYFEKERSYSSNEALRNNFLRIHENFFKR